MEMEDLLRKITGLDNSASRKDLRNICRTFSNLVLEEYLPSGTTILVVESFFSNVNLFDASGSESLVTEAYLSFDRFSERDKISLYKAVLGNYRNYNNVNFCFFTCDFIVRKFPEGYFADLCDANYKISKEAGRSGLIFGLSVAKLVGYSQKDIEQIDIILNPK